MLLVVGLDAAILIHRRVFHDDKAGLLGFASHAQVIPHQAALWKPGQQAVESTLLANLFGLQIPPNEANTFSPATSTVWQ